MILIVLVLVLSLLSYYTSSLNLFGKPSPSSSQIQVPDLYVQYLPSKDKFNAIPTKSLIDFGKIVKGPIIPVQCRKGECRKCEVMIEGKTSKLSLKLLSLSSSLSKVK